MTSGIETSLQRAQDRLAQLSTELHEWVGTQKAPLRHHHDADAGTHEWRIEAPASVPDEINQRASAVLSELRVALDDAVREAAGAPGNDAIRFPITASIGEFEQAAATQLAGTSDALRAAIEGLQLYQAPPTPVIANLAILGRLSGAAAQGAVVGQVIIASGIDSSAIEFSSTEEGTTAEVTAGYGIGQPANGELALRIAVTPPTTPIQVTPFDPPSLVIAFGDQQSRVAIPDMQNLVATVARVQQDLSIYAPAPAPQVPSAPVEQAPEAAAPAAPVAPDAPAAPAPPAAPQPPAAS